MLQRVGPYELSRRLGTGGMGTVYIGTRADRSGTREVAIKVIAEHVIDDPRVAKAARAEAEITSQLSNAHVVHVIDWGTDERGNTYIAMEYVQGGSLAELLPGLEALRYHDPHVWAKLVAHTISQLLTALDYVHTEVDIDGNPLNIVHRDVKPANILVSNRGEFKLTDFGIAGFATDGTTGTGIKGTFRYMAPEVANSIEGDRRAPPVDIYAAGIILWEALMGDSFRRGDKEIELFTQTASGHIPPPTREAPAALLSAAMAMLNPDPRQRPTARDGRRLIHAFSKENMSDELAELCQRQTRHSIGRSATPQSAPPPGGTAAVQGQPAAMPAVPSPVSPPPLADTAFGAPSIFGGPGSGPADPTPGIHAGAHAPFPSAPVTTPAPVGGQGQAPAEGTAILPPDFGTPLPIHAKPPSRISRPPAMVSAAAVAAPASVAPSSGEASRPAPAAHTPVGTPDLSHAQPNTYFSSPGAEPTVFIAETSKKRTVALILGLGLTTLVAAVGVGYAVVGSQETSNTVALPTKPAPLAVPEAKRQQRKEPQDPVVLAASDAVEVTTPAAQKEPEAEEKPQAQSPVEQTEEAKDPAPPPAAHPEPTEAPPARKIEAPKAEPSARPAARSPKQSKRKKPDGPPVRVHLRAQGFAAGEKVGIVLSGKTYRAGTAQLLPSGRYSARYKLGSKKMGSKSLNLKAGKEWVVTATPEGLKTESW